MRSSKTNFLIFLIASFSMTQVRIIGSIGVSELIIFLVAPFVYIQDLPMLRRHGFSTAINLAWLACLGCVISSIYNHTYLLNALRGVAACYALVAIPVVLHRLLWNNLDGFKWFILGVCVSGILTLFGMRTGVEEAMVERLGDATESELYFGRHFASFFTLPLYIFYFKTPTIIAVLCAMFPSVLTIATTSTGRSQIMTSFAGILLVLFINKKVINMERVKRCFWILAIGGLCFVSLLAAAYKVAAKSGVLNEKAQKKYESQQGDSKGGALSLIMHGRSEFFIALFACCDEPIFGFGPWPVDRRGYTTDFLAKYGDSEAYENLLEHRKNLNALGITEFLLPGHSHLMTHWLCYGILGLPYWIYILYLMFKVMRKHLSAIPQWCGYFVMAIPGSIWNVFFSPLSGRVETSFFIVCLLLAIAVGEGRIALSVKMQREANGHI